MIEQARDLIDTYTMVQKNRIAFGNRVDAIEQGRDQADEATLRILKRYHGRFAAFEEEIAEDIRLLTNGEEIIERMVDVKGVGQHLAAKVACHIDITKAPTVSSLWKYAGLAVRDDGKADRPVKGEKLGYNKRLKTAVWLVGSSFVKQRNSPYRDEYDRAKAYYEENRKDWTKMHRHLAAQRKMVKVWLSHLWFVWRSIEGLETRSPYAIEKMDEHTHEKIYSDYGWETV